MPHLSTDDEKTTTTETLPVPMLAMGLALLPLFTQAEFFADGKTGLKLRNSHFNRNYHRPDTSRSYSEGWTQDSLSRYESGYTERLSGLGINALGLLDVRLDSSPERSDSGLLSYSMSDQRIAHGYPSLGLTAKLRVSHNTLRIGTLMPRLPMVQLSDTRLCPQTFQGGPPEVSGIGGLALQFSQLRQVKQRDSANAGNLSITYGNKHNVLTGQRPDSDRFDFAGSIYHWSECLSSSYRYANLEDFYCRHHLGMQHLLPLAGDQPLKFDTRWVRLTDENGSRVDNHMLDALFAYRLDDHVFGLDCQRTSGGNDFAYLVGTDLCLISFVQIGNFANRDERSWQLRYDYDFTTTDLPGLTFMSCYLHGEHIDLLDDGRCGEEWERDIDIAYLVRSGLLENLGVRLCNGTFRSDFGSDINETRLVISYALPLWRRGLGSPGVSAPLTL